MTALCFVDANVLVYAKNRSEIRKQEIASELLIRLWREQAARTSIQAINEFYSVVTRKVSLAVPHEVAWQVVDELLAWNPRPIDAELVQQARAVQVCYKLNWWDCLIVAAAQLQDCAVLYSEELQHGANFDGVRVCNPFLQQVQESPGEYRVEPDSRHRPRGRPRKIAA